MEKIKLFLTSEKGKDIMIVLIVIMVGLASFALGRLSMGPTNLGVKIEYPEALSGATINSSNTSKIEPKTELEGDKGFFASSRGKKYYPTNCEAGKSIKQENRVYFKTETEAINAGYEKSASCR